MTAIQGSALPQVRLTNRQIADERIQDVLAAAVAQMLLGEGNVWGWTLPDGSLLDGTTVMHIANYRDMRTKIARGGYQDLNEVARDLKISYQPSKAARMGRIGACFHRLELWNKGAKEIEIGTLLKDRHRLIQVGRHVLEAGHTSLQQGLIEVAPRSFTGQEIALEQRLAGSEESCAAAIRSEMSLFISEHKTPQTVEQFNASATRRERLNAELAFFAWQAKQAGTGTFLEKTAQGIIDSLRGSFSEPLAQQFEILAAGLQRSRELGAESVEQHLAALQDPELSGIDQQVRASLVAKHYSHRQRDLQQGARDTLKQATASVVGKLSETFGELSETPDASRMNQALSAIRLLDTLTEVLPQSEACDVTNQEVTTSRADQELSRCEELLNAMEQHPLLQGLHGYTDLVGQLLSDWKDWVGETAAAIDVGSRLVGLAADVGGKKASEVKRSVAHLMEKLPVSMREHTRNAVKAVTGNDVYQILELSAAVFRTREKPQDAGHRAILEQIQSDSKEGTKCVSQAMEEASIPIQLGQLMRRLVEDRSLSDADRQVHRDFIRNEVALWLDQATSHRMRLQDLDQTLQAGQDTKALELVEQLQSQAMVQQVDGSARQFLEQLQIQGLADPEAVGELLAKVDLINDACANPLEKFADPEMQAYYGSNPMEDLLAKDPSAQELVLSSPGLAGAAGLAEYRMAELTLESRAKLLVGLTALNAQFEKVEVKASCPQSLKKVMGKLVWNLIKILFWHLPRLVLWHLPRLTGKFVGAAFDLFVDKVYDRIAPVAQKIARATGNVMGGALRVVGAAVEGTEAGLNQANRLVAQV